MLIERVTTATIRDYVDQRRKTGRAEATISNELAVLKRAFHLGQKSTPPKVGRVPGFPTLKKCEPRQGFFEVEQYDAMRNALPEEVRPILTFAYWTGCRRKEILDLRWDQVDLTRSENMGLVTLKHGETKNGEARLIPITGELLRVLRHQLSVRKEYQPNTPWVFFRHASGNPIRDFRTAWTRACKQCGLWDATAGKVDPITGQPLGKTTRLLHDNRRTAVRNSSRSGTPDVVSMKISGHKTRSVFDRYNITSEEDLFKAALRQGEFIAKQRQEREVCKTFANEGNNARLEIKKASPISVLN